MKNNKIRVVFLALWLFVLVGCSISYCNTEKTVSDSRFSDMVECKYYCGDGVMAYITHDIQVYYISNINGFKSGYIPNSEDSRAVYGWGSNIVILSGNGSIQIYDVIEEVFFEINEDMEPYYFRPLARALKACGGDVDDLYFSAPDCFALSCNGEWINYPDYLNWVDWNKTKWLKGNTPSPTVVLLDNGLVEADKRMVNAVELNILKTWSDIDEIAVGEGVYGLTKDGIVLSVNPLRDGASDVNDWKDIIHIDATSNFVIGVKKDGTVMFAGKKSEEIGGIEEWNNIKYVKVTPFYVFAVTCDNRFLFLAFNEMKETPNYIAEDSFPATFF